MEVTFPRDLFEGLVQLAKDNHPYEVFLLLRGRIENCRVRVDELVFPLGATFGLNFSSFQPYNLPLDPSIIGSIHSHPSGISKPSIQDMHAFYGVVMVILAYPYDLASSSAYDKSGKAIRIKLI